jgi:hypothetical protein
MSHARVDRYRVRPPLHRRHRDRTAQARSLAEAARLDPPRAIVRSRERSRRKRARRKNATHCYTIEIADHIAEGVITALVATENLTEAEACDHARVQAELSRMVCEWAQRWMR